MTTNGENQRTSEPQNLFSHQYQDDSRDSSTSSSEETDPSIVPTSQRDRRLSKEWDASKVPPSRFQKLEGSIFATPASRDGHVAKNKLKMVVEKVKDKTHGRGDRKKGERDTVI